VFERFVLCEYDHHHFVMEEVSIVWMAIMREMILSYTAAFMIEQQKGLKGWHYLFVFSKNICSDGT